tara:strand:- start:422 stop:1252 length:831 start_codon:yes stop_codon:yes gene_type:complete
MPKKKFFIIGKPLSHSLSPTLHNYWLKKYNVNADYNILEIQETEIEKILRQIKNGEILGINVTLPYKKKVIPYLDKIINDANESKSVNTIYCNQEGNLIGENTDIFGLQAGYFKEIINPENKKSKTLILGAGGVSSSVILALSKSLIKDITLSNRTYEKSIFLKKQFPFIQVLKWEEIEKNVPQFDIIINATSLGLKNGDDFEFLFKNFKKNLIYIDTIYNPLKTKMISHLEKNNIRSFNGLDMFIYQGQKSFYIWNKINPEIDEELINLLKFKIK